MVRWGYERAGSTSYLGSGSSGENGGNSLHHLASHIWENKRPKHLTGYHHGFNEECQAMGYVTVEAPPHS